MICSSLVAVALVLALELAMVRHLLIGSNGFAGHNYGNRKSIFWDENLIQSYGYRCLHYPNFHMDDIASRFNKSTRWVVWRTGDSWVMSISKEYNLTNPKFKTKRPARGLHCTCLMFSLGPISCKYHQLGTKRKKKWAKIEGKTNLSYQDIKPSELVFHKLS